MFATRAPLILNFAYAVTLAAPVIAMWSARMARRGNYAGHKRLHGLLLSVAVGAVLALEVQIRLAGGGRALIRESPFAGTAALRNMVIVHISGAVLTYALWIWLYFKSAANYRKTLPGNFSSRHRRLGWTVIGGLIFTSVSASFVYVMGFVKV